MRCAAQGNGTYINPILPGDYPDPSVLRVGSDYYMTHSSFHYGPGLLIWHSRNLVHWKPVCQAVYDYPGDVWAPDLCRHGDRFYIYYPAEGTNWVVTAPSPEGPWSKPVDLKIGYIDPGHVAGPDGRRYLHLSEGVIVELADDGLSVTGVPRKVYGGWTYPEEWKVEGFCLEAPKLLRRNGYYYLTVAQGGTAGPATSHMVVSARSTTPWGPWENSPYNPIIHTEHKKERWWSKGHGTLVDTPQGNWYVMYHAYEKDFLTLGRQTLMEPVEWTEDGWFRVPDGCRADTALPMPDGEAGEHGIALSDDFTGDRLGLQWRFFREHDPARYRLGGHGLTVEGAGRTAQNCSPLLCIPQDHAYDVRVKVSLQGEADARLLLFYNRSCYSGIGFNGASVFPIRMTQNGIPWDAADWQGETVWLRIMNELHDAVLLYSGDGVSWRRLPCTVETSGYHHNVFGGFTSLRVGLDVIGGGSACFREFRYTQI